MEGLKLPSGFCAEQRFGKKKKIIHHATEILLNFYNNIELIKLSRNNEVDIKAEYYNVYISYSPYTNFFLYKITPTHITKVLKVNQKEKIN